MPGIPLGGGVVGARFGADLAAAGVAEFIEDAQGIAQDRPATRTSPAL
jgi:hypothetical protein